MVGAKKMNYAEIITIINGKTVYTDETILNF